MSKERKIRRVKDIIRHDRKSVKRAGIITVILLMPTLITGVIFFGFGNKAPGEVGIMPSEVITICMLAFPMLGMVLLASFAGYLEGLFYLRALAMKGLAVPEDKSVFHNKLSELPRTEIEEKEGPVHWPSLIFFVLVLGVDVFFLIYTMTVTKTSHFIIVGGLFLLTLFYISAVFNKWYKNNVDIDALDSRLVRRSIFTKTVEFIVVCVIALVGMIMVDNMPCSNGNEYERVIHYCKEKYGDTWRYYPDELPASASEVKFMQWGTYGSVRFYTNQNELKDVIAHFESIDESYIVYKADDEGFYQAYNKAVTNNPYFVGGKPEDCVVYEFDEYYISTTSDYRESWYAVIDTATGEVAYGRTRD